MNTAISLLAFGLQLTLCQVQGCLSPYKIIGGVCVHVSTKLMSWCDAQSFCATVNGELIRGTNFVPFSGNSFTGLPLNYWIGMTDFLQETHKLQSGWQWTDGSLTPASSSLSWHNQEPDFAPEDCVLQQENKLKNHPCGWTAGGAVCQPKPEFNSTNKVRDYRKASFVSNVSSTEEWANLGCVKSLTNTPTDLECGRHCGSEPKDTCVAFFYNEVKRECKLLLHMDAKIQLTDFSGWKKVMLQK